MSARLLLLLAVLTAVVLPACADGPEPTPSSTVNRAGGPPVDEGAPETGGVLFNGN